MKRDSLSSYDPNDGISFAYFLENGKMFQQMENL